MVKSLEQLRRDAKALRKAHEAGEIRARQRIADYPPRPDGTVLKCADDLHVIARENMLEERGADTTLSDIETLLAGAADGLPSKRFLDPEEIPDAYRNIIRMILHFPGKLDHIKNLVAAGVEYDRPDTERLTPAQAAVQRSIKAVNRMTDKMGPTESSWALPFHICTVWAPSLRGA